MKTRYFMNPSVAPKEQKKFEDIPSGHGFLDPRSGYKYYKLRNMGIDMTGGAGAVTGLFGGRYVDLGPHDLHIKNEDED